MGGKVVLVYGFEPAELVAVAVSSQGRGRLVSGCSEKKSNIIDRTVLNGFSRRVYELLQNVASKVGEEVEAEGGLGRLYDFVMNEALASPSVWETLALLGKGEKLIGVVAPCAGMTKLSSSIAWYAIASIAVEMEATLVLDVASCSHLLPAIISAVSERGSVENVKKLAGGEVVLLDKAKIPRVERLYLGFIMSLLAESPARKG